MKKWMLIVCALAMFIPLTMRGASPEDEKMAQEREEFIASKPMGWQDLQCRAIERALKGDYKDLNNIRKGRNVAFVSDSTLVKVRDFVITDEDGEKDWSIPARLYLPAKRDEDKPLPLLVYFHGGGWTIGSIESCAKFCSALAATGDIAVMAIDYELAPEKGFPAAQGDCMMSVAYAMDNAQALGTSPELISVGGDSSGGNLAIVTAIMFPAFGSRLRSVVAFYPVTKAYDDGSDSWKEYGRCYGLDSDLMQAFNKSYLNDSVEQFQFLASPGDCEDELLQMFPPLLMISAGKDILLDQGKEFAQKVSKMGVEVRHEIYPEACHLFITVAGQPTAFGKAVESTHEFLRIK